MRETVSEELGGGRGGPQSSSTTRIIHQRAVYTRCLCYHIVSDRYACNEDGIHVHILKIATSMESSLEAAYPATATENSWSRFP